MISGICPEPASGGREPPDGGRPGADAGQHRGGIDGAGLAAQVVAHQGVHGVLGGGVGGAHPAIWVTERAARISARQVDDRFAQFRALAGLPAELSVHCLRHSYVSHQFRGRGRSAVRAAAGRALVGAGYRDLYHGGC